MRDRKKNALQIVHLCLAQSEIAKAFDDGRAVPFVELESDCFVPAWLCIRPVITQPQRGQILDYLTFDFFLRHKGFRTKKPTNQTALCLPGYVSVRS